MGADFSTEVSTWALFTLTLVKRTYMSEAAQHPPCQQGAPLGVHIMFSSNLMSLFFRCQAGYWLLLVLPVVTLRLVQP